MKITFNSQDKIPFFKMLCVYKFYIDLSEIQQKEIEPPFSFIDVILLNLGEKIADNHYYKSTFETDNAHFISQYMLATEQYTLYNNNNELSNFEKTILEPLSYFKIDIDKLWEDILKNGIEVGPKK